MNRMNPMTGYKKVSANGLLIFLFLILTCVFTSPSNVVYGSDRSGTGIVLPDNTVLLGEDLTNIPKNAKIKFTIVDQNPIVQIDEKKAIKVMEGVREITGTSTLQDLKIPGMSAYSVIFKPDHDLELNKSFIASIQPSYIGDPQINKINTKSFKFTTKTNADWEDFDDPSRQTSSNPHGHYTLNTNMCSTCHSTHKGSTDTLEVKPSDDATQNYCMACHDGTLNAPAIKNRNSKNHHTAGVDKTQQASCTTCHNPHLDWSKENPNLLKDHYVYNHKAADLNQNGLTSLKVDSLDISCINCHEENTALDSASDTNKSIFDTTTFKNGYYEFLQYKKSLTADGSMDNYSLCLSCHADIKQYYQEGVASQHTIAAQDGSKLEGFLPCSECHETHGSNNSFLLKSTFGHDNPTDGFTFTGDIKEWDVNTEKQFCMKCHNGSTAVYGVTAKLPSPEYHPSLTAACSSCHGTGALSRDRILSAAHGPISIPLLDPVSTTSTSSTTTETNASTTTSTTINTTDPTDTTSSGTGSTADEPGLPTNDSGTVTTPAESGSTATETGTTPTTDANN